MATRKGVGCGAAASGQIQPGQSQIEGENISPQNGWQLPTRCRRVAAVYGRQNREEEMEAAKSVEEETGNGVGDHNGADHATSDVHVLCDPQEWRRGHR